jgi:hypothetical protein
LLCVECFVWMSVRQQHLLYKSLTEWFCITVVENIYCTVRADSLYKADYIESLEG